MCLEGVVVRFSVFYNENKLLSHATSPVEKLLAKEVFRHASEEQAALGLAQAAPFALQGQKRKKQRLPFVHTLHLLYMLLPLQGESTVVDSSPRAPLRSALG